MRDESKKICRQLLLRHRTTTAKLSSEEPVVRGQHTITYGELCARAGVPHLTRRVGGFLLEIADWCQASGFPPLNSLAVNSRTRRPSDNYDGAGGFRIINWPTDVEKCIRFPGYPATPPP